ncbi:MAG: GAF domain-containing protein [Chloroflexi bacterium]|nr:GAF domain-containing protein [Chloroflexota bacterium]
MQALVAGQADAVLDPASGRAILLRQAQESLLEGNEQQLRAVFEGALDAMLMVDDDGRCLDANPVACGLFGLPIEKLRGRPLEEMGMSGPFRDQVQPTFLQARQARGEFPLRDRAGIVRHLEYSTIVNILPGRHLLVLRDMTERRQRERELKVVVTMSATLRTAQTRAEMLPIILDQLVGLLNVSQAALVMRDERGGETMIEMARGKWADLTGQRLPPGESVCGHVIAAGRPCLSQDIRHEPFGAGLGLVTELQSAAAAPLITQGKTIGALVVGSERTISDDHIRLLTAIADMAANAIHRETLHEQTEARLRRLTALYQIDTAINSSLDLHVTLNVLLDNVVTQLGVDAADVLLFNSSSQILEYAAGRGFRTDGITRSCVRLGEGQAGRAALERRMVSLPAQAEAVAVSARARLLAEEEFVSHHVAPLVAKGQIKGVLEIFHRTRLDPDHEWLDFLDALATQAAIAIDLVALFEGLQRSNVELILAYDATIEGWSRALDLRDKETEGHTQRVTEMTVELARAMGMSEADLVHVWRGGLLHDIGKMGIPDSLLHKTGSLTDGEWEIMRRHPVYAYDMLSPIAFLRPALDIPYCHHEKWDGTGYPRGLKGEEIPLAARIFAVADVWDALRSDRPYREGWPEEKVREYISEQTGRHFNPSVVEAFLQLADSWNHR